MWMEIISEGKFSFRERYIDPYTGKYKKVSITMNSKSRQAKNEAQRILNSKIQEKMNAVKLTNDNITFGEVVEEWKVQYQQQVKLSSFYSSRHSLITLLQYIKPDFLVKNIDHIIINKALEELLYGEKKLSNGYVRKIKSRLNLILKFAKKKGYIDSNPMDKVEISYKREEYNNVRMLFLEDEEYNKIIDVVKNHNVRYYLLFQWLYLNGLRAGEATAMVYDDITIDYESNTFQASINGTLEYHGIKISEQVKSDTTKTTESMREIDLSQKAVKIFEQAKELNQSLDTDLVFCTSKGTPIQITAINTYLRNYVKPKVGFEKNMSSHIFRHTHVSKLAEIGTPLFAIQDRVGHDSTSKITEAIYLHVTQGVKDRLKKDIELL